MSCVSDAEHFPVSLIALMQVSIKLEKNIYQPEIPMVDLQAKSKLSLLLQTAKRLLLAFGGENVEQAKNPPLVSFELSATEPRTGRNILFQLGVALRKARGVQASRSLASPPG